MNRFLPFVALLALVFVALFFLTPASAQQPDFDLGFTIRLTSVEGAGELGKDPGVFEPDLSASGQRACFHSRAINLVPAATDGTDHVYFVEPLVETPVMQLISRADDGTPGNGDSHDAVISKGRDAEGHEGRYVAFVSGADNLVPGDTNNIPDIFVHDRIDDRIARVSVDSNGAQGTYTGHYETICHADVTISDNGRYVAFVSMAALDPRDSNEFADIYVHDRDYDEDGILDEQSESGGIRTWIASLNERGEPLDGHCGRPALSGNGEKLAWVSWAANVLPDSMPPDSNDDIDGFWTDVGLLRRQGEYQTLLITQAMDGGWQNVGGCTPSMSRDGRYVSFTSHSTNLAPRTGPVTTPPPSESDVPLKAFLRDMWDSRPNKTLHISRSYIDGGPANGNAYRTVLSEDDFRLFVGFAGDATDLHPGDEDTLRDLFTAKIQRDPFGRLVASETYLVSVEFPSSEKSTGQSNDVALSNRSNITGILFTSQAPNWGDGPAGEGFDLYLSGKRLNQ